MAKAVRRRTRIAEWCVLAAVFLVLVVPALFLPSVTSAVLAGVAMLVVGGWILWCVDRYTSVPCPICVSAKLNENVPAGPPGWSEKGIEHRCPDCGAFFIDYCRVEEGES